MNEEFLCYKPLGASHRLVLLHGWGADAEDLMPLGRDLSEENDGRFEVLALRAPQMNSQGLGRQWYGLFPADWSAVPKAIEELKVRFGGLPNSSIPLQNTVLLGFSQGGAVALAVGCELPLAGVIGCSAYPHPGWRPPITSPPVLLVHGQKDEVVPIGASHKLIESFKSNEVDAELVIFNGGHSIPPAVLPRLRKCLGQWCFQN